MAFVLKALGLTYESKYLAFDKAEQKTPAFLAVNPNGCVPTLATSGRTADLAPHTPAVTVYSRIPALVDHNDGDFTVWESDAIMVYLVEKCALLCFVPQAR